MRQSELEARPGADSVARVIGGRVRLGRDTRGWTLDQLAERSGVSRRILVSIEQGSANPSIATLLLLSDALGLTAAGDDLASSLIRLSKQCGAHVR